MPSDNQLMSAKPANTSHGRSGMGERPEITNADKIMAIAPVVAMASSATLTMVMSSKVTFL